VGDWISIEAGARVDARAIVVDGAHIGPGESQ
jgi:hypothetical protein